MTTTTPAAGPLLLRLGVAATVALSGYLHAELYLRGYHHIPVIGPAFLLQAGISFAVAVLLLLSGPSWLELAAAALAAGALTGFVLSRTVGVAGFTERGWQPAPQAVLSVQAEALTIVLVGTALLVRRRLPLPGTGDRETAPAVPVHRAGPGDSASAIRS